MKQLAFDISDKSNTDLLHLLYLLRTAELYLQSRISGNEKAYKTFTSLVGSINKRMGLLNENGDPKTQ